MMRNFVGWQDSSRILQFIEPGEEVLDFGCGSGATAHYLKEAGRRVSGCDIKDHRKHKDFPFKLTERIKAPFKDESFDAVILAFVLHHCAKDQEKVLREAVRVARKKVIVLEDVPNSGTEEAWVRALDIVCNLPHGVQTNMVYHSEKGWERVFNDAGLEVKARKRVRTVPVPVRKVLYVLEKKPKELVARK